MATIDTARGLYNGLINSNISSPASGRAAGALLQAIMTYNAWNPPLGALPPRPFFLQQGTPSTPNTLQGDWNAVYSAAFAQANALCTTAGASAPVAYVTTAAGLAALQARIATAQGLQAASPSMLAALASSLTALNLAYGTGLPVQNDAAVLAAGIAAANAALASAVTDAQAVCTAFGISASAS